MPSKDVSRRRLLALSGGGLAALAGCLADSTGPSTPDSEDDGTPDEPASDSPPEQTPGEDDCAKRVGDEWDSHDESPTRPHCPGKPGSLRPCPVRAYVLGLERHLRYVRAMKRYDDLQSLEFGVYGATVEARESSVLVHADLFFAGTEASESTGTPIPVHFDDDYAVSYLVTAEAQWRVADRTGNDRASANPREDGDRVSCRSSSG